MFGPKQGQIYSRFDSTGTPSTRDGPVPDRKL